MVVEALGLYDQVILLYNSHILQVWRTLAAGKLNSGTFERQVNQYERN